MALVIIHKRVMRLSLPPRRNHKTGQNAQNRSWLVLDYRPDPLREGAVRGRLCRGHRPAAAQGREDRGRSSCVVITSLTLTPTTMPESKPPEDRIKHPGAKYHPEQNSKLRFSNPWNPPCATSN